MSQIECFSRVEHSFLASVTSKERHDGACKNSRSQDFLHYRLFPNKHEYLKWLSSIKSDSAGRASEGIIL